VGGAADVQAPDPAEYGRRRGGRRHLVGPLVLLGAGVLLLLNNLQILPWTIWRDLWPYWPVLLILIGLEAFVSGRVAWGTLVALVLLIPMAGVAVSAIDLASNWDDATQAVDGTARPVFSQPFDGATSARVELEYGAGALDIGPIPADLQGTVLADGQVYGHESLKFDARSTARDGQRRIDISPRDSGNHFDLGRLQLRLSPTVPTDLEIDSGISEMTLNLETLRIPNLSIETGASRASIVLPARGRTNARIEGGAARIDITVPPNVAARITLDGGPNQIQIDEQRFPRQGDVYQSPGFETAADRVTLRIGVGASRLTVQ
jgi:hypothetical protein